LRNKINNIIILVMLLAAIIVGCTQVNNNTAKPETEQQIENIAIEETGKYTTSEDIALYIHTYNKLPSNFITKKEAAKLGWKSDEGNLWKVTEQKSIGGDIFGNREGKLPSKDGRKWYECDVNYEGGFRGAERIVYSNDGLIYYTEDHYKTFIRIY
jgi:guanyl-specific ribonuclease Sa